MRSEAMSLIDVMSVTLSVTLLLAALSLIAKANVY